MSVETSWCTTCGDDFRQGQDGEHAADTHRTSVEVVADLFKEHSPDNDWGWGTTCGCGWEPKGKTEGMMVDTFEEHFTTLLGHRARRENEPWTADR